MQHEILSSLPQPDARSSSHSLRVAEHIRSRIDAAGGQISFAEYMHEALYASGLGYYAAGSIKFGAGGDFTTAPEISPVFGAILARQCAEVLAKTGQGVVLELGAGSGRLAVDMLQTFERIEAMPAAYHILEVSADLRERQEALLRASVPHLLENVQWVSGFPQQHVGVVVANEVLDALPVERFSIAGSDVMQVCVSYDDVGFQWTTGAATEQLRAAVAGIEVDIGHALADGYTSEVSLAGPAWAADIAQSLSYGAVFLFDYGVSRREYYAPNRDDGWLRCHYRHRAHGNPLILPGIQDLTTWVDFSAIAESAVSNDLQILGYQTQSQFLMGGGLDAEMQQFAELSVQQQLALSSQIKTLTLPGEMGENFKCMALGRGSVPSPSAFLLADRTQTL